MFRISRDHKAGRIRRLAHGLYTTNLDEPPERLVRRLLWEIVSLLFPGAVVSARTALGGEPARDGSVFLTSDTDRDVELPGVLLRARKGPGRLPGDTPMHGVYVASRARAYLENMQTTRARRSVSRSVSRYELEQRIAADLRERGVKYMQGVMREAKGIAGRLGMKGELRELEGVVAGVVGMRRPV